VTPPWRRSWWTRTPDRASCRSQAGRRIFKALLPDPAAATPAATVAAVRVLAERIADVSRPPQADIEQVADAWTRCWTARWAPRSTSSAPPPRAANPDALIDLSQIDFDALAASFAGRKRAETDRLAALLKQRAIGAATRNPTRYDLVERIEELIAEYNAGSVNIDEYLRRLVELSKTLTDEEQRAVAEGLTEEELAVFDLLTKPEPVLTDDEREVVKGQRQAPARSGARQAGPRLAAQVSDHGRGTDHHPRRPRRRAAR
jgi:type I restriction enzyme R subunit